MKTTLRSLAAAALMLSAPPAFAGDAAAPYKIGYLVDASGPMQGIFSPGLEAFRLFVDRVNAEGGVNGRPIELLVRDVQVDPQRSATAAQELISDGAIAIAGLSLTSTHMAVYAATARRQVPVLAGFPANVGAILPPAKDYFYGVGLAFEVAGEVGGQLARQAAPEGKTFVCTVFESSGGFVACDGAIAAAKAAGFTTAEKVTFPVQQRDFRAIAEKINQLKPDVVLTILGRGRTLPFLPALSEAGFKGKVLSMECGTGDDELREAAKAAPGIEVFSYSRYVGGGQGSGPDVTALEAAARQAGVKELLSFHSGGWVLGKVLVDALKRCGKDCTATGLNAALSDTQVDTGGLTGTPVRFTKDDHYGRTAYRLFAYDRGADQVRGIGDWLEVDSTPVHAKRSN